MSFKKLGISDREKFKKYFELDSRKGCEYSFACNFIWQDVYNSTFAIIENCYVAKSTFSDKNVYSLPLGKQEDMIKAMKYIMDIEGENTIFRGILEYHIPFIKEHFGDIFSFSCNRDDSDYIYLSDDLINLVGKKFQSKRNLIKRFNDNPNWIYEEIDKTNIGECIELNSIWSDGKNVISSDDMRKEIGAANTALAYFDELNLKGGLIRREGKVVAYSLGEKLTDDTFVVHFEKALESIKGCYQTINNEFAKRNCSEFKYINREEDTGNEGLRKAKLSYRPVIILDKYVAKINKRKI